MAQTNFTPILTYKSDTATAVPSAGNLTNSANGAEMAVNTADKRLFTKDSGGNVVELGTNPSSLTLPNSTANGVVYANGSKVLTTGSALTFDGTDLAVGNAGGLALFKRASDGLSVGRVGSRSSTDISMYNAGGVTAEFVAGANELRFNVAAAEQMRLTSTGLGIGTSSPQRKLDIYDATAPTFALHNATSGTGSNDGFLLFTLGSDVTLVNYESGYMAFSTSDAERMRLDTSGNLGIGTSSPGAKLHVDSGATALMGILNSTNANGGYITGQSSGVAVWDLGTAKQAFNTGTSTDVGLTTRSGFLGFGTASTERMRIDSSGNLGLGVTPSASPNCVNLELPNGSTLSSRNVVPQFAIMTNAVGDWYGATYKTTAPANMYLLSTGQHNWYNAPSGTAGNVITFTQAMTLDASGNLGIGTSSPRGLLDLNTNRSVKVYFGDSGTIGETQSGAGDYIANNLYVSAEVAGSMTYTKTTGDNGNAILQDYSRGITFYTGVTGANGTTGTLNNFERMRLDSSGNLGIGTATPATILQASLSSSSTGLVVAGAVPTIVVYDSSGTTGKAFFGQIDTTTYLYNAEAGPLVFGTSNNERMRLDSSGNLGLGVTPSAWGAGYKAIQNLGTSWFATTSRDANFATNVYVDAGGYKYIDTAAASNYTQYLGAHSWYTAPSGTAGNAITFTQAMTLDASGNLLVGTTSALISSLRRGLSVLAPTGTFVAASFANDGGSSAQTVEVWNQATTGDNSFIAFYTEATVTTRGSISYNRAGGLVAYNTTSDYRAKDIIGPVQNPGAMIDALKVYEGQMKGATQSRPMLIAHEAQAVTPYAVTGEKDAVNEDGTPKLQQMDVSALVPLLLAELQSLRARVAQLESKP